MLDADEENAASCSWRSELSNVYLWYASYGSNMWMPRFECYIAGGQVMHYSNQVVFLIFYYKFK
jgi:histone deacetylase 6